MPTIVRVFADQAAAEAARERVVGTGVPRDCVALSFQGDEAGAVGGNFLTGNDAPRGNASPEEYDWKYGQIQHASKYILTIDATPEQVPDAEAALAELSGKAVDELRSTP
jgi:hypothetical protein